jgi:hypothetical protein
MNMILPSAINPEQVTDRFWQTIDLLIERDIIEGLHTFCKPFNLTELQLQDLRKLNENPPDDFINYLVLRYQANPLFLWHGEMPIILPTTNSDSGI